LLEKFSVADKETSVFTYGVLPHNDQVATVADTVRYASSRSAVAVEVLGAHISIDTVLDLETGQDTTPQDVGFVSLEGEWTSQSTKTWDSGVASGKFSCDGTPAVVGSGKFCIYGDGATEASNFILPTLTPTTAYIEKDKTLSEVAASPNSALTNGDVNDIETVLALINQNSYLVPVLTGDEWYTVFAPNAAAVTNLVSELDAEVDGVTIDATAVTTFLTWNEYLTGNVLKGHVVPGSATPTWSEDLPADNASAEEIQTVLGPIEYTPAITTSQAADATLKPKDDPSTLFSPKIVSPDVYTKDAVVHVINEFLLTSAQVTLVVDALKRASLADALETDSTLVTLVDKASDAIGETLAEAKQRTLFAPANTAFEKLSGEQTTYLTENVDELDKVLKAHVFTSAYFGEGSAAAAAGTEVSLKDLNKNEIKCTRQECTINGATVTLSNQRTTLHGVVYDINSVIVPSDVELPSDASTVTITIAATMLSAMAAIALV